MVRLWVFNEGFDEGFAEKFQFQNGTIMRSFVLDESNTGGIFQFQNGTIMSYTFFGLF